MVDLKGIVLNEISQIEEDKYCMLSPVYEYPPTRKPKLIEEIRLVVARDGDGWGGGWIKWMKVDKRYKIPAVR